MDKVIVLMLSILMPPQSPDVSHTALMKDIGSCWKAAQEFMKKDLTDDMRKHGAIGKAAGCMVGEKSKEVQKQDAPSKKEEGKL